MTEVTVPTGSSYGGRAERANVSTTIRNTAPPSRHTGIRLLWSGPIKDLNMCGTMSPTKPITPHMETQVATSIDDPSRIIRRTLFTFTPRARALDSPAVIMFMARAFTAMSRTPRTIGGSMTARSPHLRPSKLPSIQNTIEVTVSASEKNSIIEVNPLKRALTAIPASRSMVVWTPPECL